MKFWDDLVPVTDAVLLSVVPLAAVTCPPIVIVTDAPPAMVPTLHVTTLPFGPPWVQLPWLLVIDELRQGGRAWMTPMPLTWSVITTLLTEAPPVFLMEIVYVSVWPEATGFLSAVFVTASGLLGLARAGMTTPGASVVNATRSETRTACQPRERMTGTRMPFPPSECRRYRPMPQHLTGPHEGSGDVLTFRDHREP